MKIKLFDEKGRELQLDPITQKVKVEDNVCYLISLPMGEQYENTNSRYSLCENLDQLLEAAGVKNTIIIPIRNKNQRPIIQKLKVSPKEKTDGE